MPKVRWRGPDYVRLGAYQRAFAPFADDAPQTRTYAPVPTRAYEPPCVKADRREAVAFHEAGHCLINLVQGRDVYSLSIDDDGGGSFRAQQPIHVTEGKEDLIFEALADDVGTDYRPHAFRMAVGFFGGLCAELRLGSDPDEARQCASVDLYRSRALAEKVCDDADDVEQFLANAQRKAEGHIERNWRLVEEIAAELNARGRLTGDDVATIVADFPVVKPPPKREKAVAPRRDSPRPYTDRGPSALGLTAPRVAVQHERAGSPHDEHLFRLRMCFLEGGY